MVDPIHFPHFDPGLTSLLDKRQTCDGWESCTDGEDEDNCEEEYRERGVYPPGANYVCNPGASGNQTRPFFLHRAVFFDGNPTCPATEGASRQGGSAGASAGASLEGSAGASPEGSAEEGGKHNTTAGSPDEPELSGVIPWYLPIIICKSSFKPTVQRMQTRLYEIILSISKVIIKEKIIFNLFFRKK